ncbi:MAG: hypothetical protein LBU89_10440 [Fibromonadaceae bacterium]|nr:hypothetical protein [Fibromonadaceae bacterium]
MSKELKDLCINRIKRCWEWLCDSHLVPTAINNVDGKQYYLDPCLVAETAVQYSSDCEILKIRYGEKNNRIQSPRIAGLMAASIGRYKPISIREGFLRSQRVPLNELLAIFNGLFVCSEFPAKSKEWTLSSFLKEKFFSKWLNDFIHLLRYRNYTAENLILTYETFCLCYCKDVFLEPKATTK